MNALTQRQAEILEYIASRRLPPTVREICAHFGYRSPQAALGHLKSLEAKGAIVRRPRSARAIEIVGTSLDCVAVQDI